MRNLCFKLKLDFVGFSVTKLYLSYWYNDVFVSVWHYNWLHYGIFSFELKLNNSENKFKIKMRLFECVYLHFYYLIVLIKPIHFRICIDNNSIASQNKKWTWSEPPFNCIVLSLNTTI